MVETLKTAAHFLRALTLLDLVEIDRSHPDQSSLNLFLPHKQLPLPWTSEGILALFPKDAVVTVTDRLLASYCFLGLTDTVLAIGPFRARNLRRFEASAKLEECHADSALLEAYMKYYSALPYKSEEDMKIIVHAIVTALYGEARSISERHIDMNAHSHQELSIASNNLSLPSIESIENRHSLEEFYMSQIAQGNFEGAYATYQRLSHNSTPAGDAMPQEGFTIIRTITRIAARNSGVPASGLHTLTETYRERSNNIRDTAEMQALTAQFISDICAIVRKFRTLSYSPPICQVIEYISRNLSETITLESLAEESGLAPTWISKKFHQETGQTITSYITQERMRTAAEYLAFTNMTVQEVSTSVGIIDSNYFTKLFKRAYGIVPKQFRKSPQYARLVATNGKQQDSMS